MDDISGLVSNFLLAAATGTAIPAFFRWMETRGKTARAVEQSLRLAEQALREEMRRDMSALKLETSTQRLRIQELELRTGQQDDTLDEAKERINFYQNELTGIGVLYKESQADLLRLKQEGARHTEEIAAVQERERICREQIAELQRRLDAVDEYRWVWQMTENPKT